MKISFGRMAELPMAERANDVFLSHAREDKPVIVERIYKFLKRSGLKVWYDEDNMTRRIRQAFAEAIPNCRSGIAVVSTNSTEKHWPTQEWELFDEQFQANNDFRVVPVIVGGASAPDKLKRYAPVRLDGDALTAGRALDLIRHLHIDPGAEHKAGLRPVYFARGGKPHELKAASSVKEALNTSRLRILRDASVDNRDSMNVRVNRTMGSCCGAVVTLPARLGGRTSPYLIAELLIALRTFGNRVPVCLFVDESLTDEGIAETLAEFVETGAGSDDKRDRATQELKDDLNHRARQLERAVREEGLGALSRLHLRGTAEQWSTQAEEWIGHFEASLLKEAARPAQAFIGHLYDPGGVSKSFERARACVEAVSGVKCASGDDHRSQGGDQASQVQLIVQEIRASSFAIIDLTGDGDRLPVNTLIEAGIAMGAGIPVYYLLKGTEREIVPPKDVFMVDMREIRAYEDDIDLLAQVTKIASYYRMVSE